MDQQQHPLTPAELQNFMVQNDIPGELLHLDVPTPTVETAAQVVNAHPDQIVKSVLFLVKGEPVLAVAYGTNHIDRRAIASRYGVGRKRIKLADPDTVLEFTGYPAGAVPPFGHPKKIPTLMDPGILDHDDVYAGGGSGSALVRLFPQDILRVTEADLIDLFGSGGGR